MADGEAQVKNAGAPPWNVGDLVKAVILSAIIIVAGVVVLLIAAKLLQHAGVSLRLLRVGLVVAQTIIQNIAFMASVWVFGLRKYRVGIDSLGLRPFRAGAGCASSALALFLALGFNVLYSALVTLGTGRQIQSTPILPLFGSGLAGLALALAIGSLLVPLVEETFFRGFIFPGLARRFGFVAGAVLSAMIFGAAHLNLDTFIPLSFFGLVLALLYSITGSIYPGIMLHSANNSFALLIAFLVETGAGPSV